MTVGEANAFRLRLSREKPATSTGIGLEMEDRPIYAATYRVGGGPVRYEPHPPHGWLKEVSLGSRRMRRCARTPAESNPKPQTPPFPSPSARPVF